MSEQRRNLIKAHIARTKDDFPKEQCSHILVAHAFHYTPTDNCEEAKNLHKHLKLQCLAQISTIIPHAPLCQTKAQHTILALLSFQIVVVITSAVGSEWLHKPPHFGA